MKRSNGIALGITGGIACGKSEVGKILRGRGVTVIEADDVAHELMRPGRPVYRRVVARFGKEFVGADDRLDRERLGRRVFRSARERAALNALVHPAVLKEIRSRVREAIRRGRPVAAIIPLLFEVGETRPWTAILCVAAPRAVALARLLRKGLSRAEAVRRIRAQWPVREKMKRANYVIVNQGSRRALIRKTRQVWNDVLKEERERHAR